MLVTAKIYKKFIVFIAKSTANRNIAIRNHKIFLAPLIIIKLISVIKGIKVIRGVYLKTLGVGKARAAKIISTLDIMADQITPSLSNDGTKINTKSKRIILIVKRPLKSNPHVATLIDGWLVDILGISPRLIVKGIFNTATL